jgi:hypothetical protein
MELKTLSFVVPGHPVGYVRTTQKGCRFDKNYKRYQDYKNLVVSEFLAQVPGDWGSPKPLTSEFKNRTHVSLKIYFKNGIHCDPDNCFKAIADSLFKCDKYVSGDFDFDYDKECPRVEVTIR